MRMGVQSQASLIGSGIGVALSCGVGCRCGSDLALLWLWCRLAATAPIRPLAWEPLGAAQEMAKDKKKKYVYIYILQFPTWTFNFFCDYYEAYVYSNLYL